MEIGKEFLDSIKALTRKADKSFTGADGKEYSFDKLHQVFSEPRPAALQVKSLLGLVGYIEANIDKLDAERLIIHIVDHKQVTLLTDVHGEDNQRHAMITANLDGLEQFPYEKFLGQETFIIKTRAMFEDTDDLAIIHQYTAKIDADESVRTQDDGIAQTVRIKKGVSGVAGDREEMPSKVVLKPYRTFAEAKQPESEFLFRVHADDGAASCALFEADGGAWRNKARENIEAFLSDKVGSIPIIA